MSAPRLCARGGRVSGWREAREVASSADVQPLQGGAWIEALARKVSAPTVKQRSPACGTCSIDW